MHQLERLVATLDCDSDGNISYEELEGWKAPTTGARRFDDLPPQARAYVERVSELSRAPVSLISVGPERDSTIDIA